MEVTGIILADDKSLKPGINKAMEMIGGKTLIERVINRLAPITTRLILVTAGNIDCFSGITSIEVIADTYSKKRPLNGIYKGLCASRTIANIVVSCDMPFLNTELLEHMAKLLPTFDAIVPRWPNGQKEPLHAVYSISCLPTMKKHLESNRLSIIHVLREMHVLHLNKRGFSSLDPEFLSFFNINDQVDIDLANKIAVKEHMESQPGR
jgi:molybdopterin-guanine dinucleotide biosynthesis protein A